MKVIKVLFFSWDKTVQRAEASDVVHLFSCHKNKPHIRDSYMKFGADLTVFPTKSFFLKPAHLKIRTTWKF